MMNQAEYVSDMDDRCGVNRCSSFGCRLPQSVFHCNQSPANLGRLIGAENNFEYV